MPRQILFTSDSQWTGPEGWDLVGIDQPDDDRRVIAAAQALLPIDESIVLGGHGAMGRLLPRIAFARRAARRPVLGYLLVDCDLPVVAGDWPDAPVTFVASTPEFRTHLKVAADRGWSIRDQIT